MFLCEILTEQQQTPSQAIVVKAHVRNAPIKAADKLEMVNQQVQPTVASQQSTEQPQTAIQDPQIDPNQQYAEPVQSYDDMDYDEDLDADTGDEVSQLPPYQGILPLKKYYLIEKLKNFKSRLDEKNIENKDFDIIIKFMNSMSYNSLVGLTTSILPVIEDQLVRLQNNEI